MVIRGQFSKTVISLPLGMGFKCVIHRLKGNIFLYSNKAERIKMNLN